MTTEQLKKQADRLIQFMGDTYRLRMKRAAALEALAVMRGVADWNTLAAQVGKEMTVPTKQARPTAYTLTWQQGRPQMVVCAREWHRHTLVLGAETHIQEWLVEQLAACIQRKERGIFFLHSDAPLPTHMFDSVTHGSLTMVDYRGEICAIDIAAGLSAPAAQNMQGLTVPVAQPGAPALPDLIAAGQVLLVVMPKADSVQARQLGRAWSIALRDLCARQMDGRASGAPRTLVLGLSRLACFDLGLLTPVVAQARAIDTTLLLGADNRAALEATQAGQLILANTWTQLYLGGLDTQLLAEMIAQLPQSTAVAVTPATVTFARGGGNVDRQAS